MKKNRTRTGRRQPGDAELESAMRRYFESILRARVRETAPSASALRAATVFALGEGIYSAMPSLNAAQGLRLSGDLTRAVASYLASYEDE